MENQTVKFIVVELAKGGDMFDYVTQSPNKKLSEQEARVFFK